jgi:hypothetical protein
MTITGTKLDFVSLPLAKTENIIDLHKEHFVKVVSDEYNYHNVGNYLSYETFLLAQQNKLEYNKPLLNGEYIVELTNKLPELKYYQTMYVLILKMFDGMSFGSNIKVNGLTFQNFDMFKDYINTIITDEALLNNSLLDNVVIDITEKVKDTTDWFIRNHPDRENLIANPVKKYQKGMKLTRFFMSVLELFNKKDKEAERAVGRFRINPDDKVKIYMSAYLPSVIQSGAIGHSCLSEGGVNEHSTFMITGYQNVLVVHDNDFAFRAFLALDHKKKYFTLAHTYPRENFFLQLMVYEYLQAEGYKAVRNYFRFPEYMDMGISDQFQAESIDSEDDENKHNKDAYFTFSKSLFTFHGNSSVNQGRIAHLYGCDGCDKSSVSPDFLNDSGYCESCQDNDEDYGNCESCDERHHNDYLHYDEENEAYYCEGCRDRIEEEREEAKREEEEREQAQAEEAEEADGEENGTSADTNVEEIRFTDIELVKKVLSSIDLEVGNNLVKKHKADDFYAGMSLIKRLPNIITNQDVALLATQRSKISNFREFTIFTTLMEAIGINWSDNTTASKYNPVKRATVRYPYYMVLGYEGSAGSQSMQRLMYNQTGTSDGTGSDNLERVNSEIYLRYFYLAKNRLQLIKDGANLYQGALTNATDLSVDEKLSVVQKSFSYADFYKIMKFEKTGRVTFKDAAAYDVFMFIAHQVGFMFNTKVPLWGRAFETSPQGFAENYYYEFNNKGFVSTHVVADGAFPADVLVLTKEMMYNFLKFGAVAF